MVFWRYKFEDVIPSNFEGKFGDIQSILSLGAHIVEDECQVQLKFACIRKRGKEFSLPLLLFSSQIFFVFGYS